ncbi:hypothetical protein IKE67_02260 [bacterium]|nr:hypothetical protein [bacterium]
MTYNYSPNFSGSTYSAYDVENLVKYATGVALTNKEDLGVKDALTGAGGNLVIQGASWLRKNRGNYRAAMQTATEASRSMHNVYVTAGRGIAGMQAASKASQASQLLSAIPSADKLAGMSKNTQSLYEQARLAAETLGQTGSKHAANTANQLLSQANAAAATGFWGKTKNVLGINKASSAISSAAAKSPIASKCLNQFKAQGGGAMLVMEGATEVVTNVVPTFKKLGKKAGMRQIGKSSVKTVASVGGWVAGAALGTKIGAAIGSIIPGAGTAIGAVAGAVIGSLCSLIGGTIGSRLAKKGAEKVVGKDELVLAKEREAKELAKQAKNNKQVLNQVAVAAAERLNAEGCNSADAQIACNSLAAVAGGQQNPFAA